MEPQKSLAAKAGCPAERCVRRENRKIVRPRVMTKRSVIVHQHKPAQQHCVAHDGIRADDRAGADQSRVGNDSGRMNQGQESSPVSLQLLGNDSTSAGNANRKQEAVVRLRFEIIR